MAKTQGTVHLTKRFIDAAEYDHSSMCIYWDDDIPGFGLRVYPGGRKSFVLKYRHLGKQHIAVIARYGDYTLEQARKDAIDKRGCLVRGEDPFAKRTQAACSTVRELGQAFLERYSKPNKSSWEHDARRLEKKIYPYLGSRVAASITRADMEGLQKKLGTHSIHEADHTLNLFSKMVEWGKYGKVDPDDFKSVATFLPEDFINPCRGIKKFPKNKRDRWVRPSDELPRLMAAVNEAANVYIRAALWLYLLTGMRKNELLRAKWEDVDSSRRELRVPKTKSGRVHYIPLNGPAMGILLRLPRVDGNPHIFVGHVTGRHLVNIDKPWRAIRERAGLTDVHLHDLRRTVGSYLAQSGTSLQLIGKVLNHSNITTTEIYARLAEEQSKQVLDSHGEKLVALAGAEFDLIPSTPDSLSDQATQREIKITSDNQKSLESTKALDRI